MLPSPVGRVLWIGALLVASCGGSDDAGDDDDVPRPDFRGGTAYEIFVRSFADSNGDGVGDLRGLTAHLDYLNDGDDATTTDLGVEAVWLMPIFPSPSYHGYDVTDYRGIQAQYGSLEDFDAFVAAAHQRGIQVILDFVINHASDQHPWFVQSASAPNAAMRDYFVWRETSPGWTRPWDSSSAWIARGGAYYYGIFCGCMPDLNLGNQTVADEITNSMKFWQARGVDGFRLDAVRYFFETGQGTGQQDQPETHAFLKRLRASLGTAQLVAEAWAPVEIQASYWGQNDETQLAFSFDLADAIKLAATSGDASSVINALARAEAAFADKDRQAEAPFLSNHDQARVMRALVGDQTAARVAAATLFAMPGTPFVYYGEEIGMLGGAGNADQNKRTPLRWNATAPGYGFTEGASTWYPGDELAGTDVASQQANAGSLWHLYRSLIAQRKERSALYAGSATRPTMSGAGPSVLAVLRTSPNGNRVVFVANYAASAAGPFTVDVAGSPTALRVEGLAGSVTSEASRLSIPGLAARGFAFVALPPL